MKSLIKAELYTFKYNKMYLLLLLISFLLGIILFIGDGKPHEWTGLYTLRFSLYNNPLLVIIVNVFAALYVGRDFIQKTLMRYIYSGHKRAHVVLVKLFIFFIYSNLILLIQPIISTILNTCIYGWGNDMDVSYAVIVFLTTFILNASICSFVFFLAFIFQDITKTLAISTVAYFLMVFILNGENARSIAHFIPLGQLRLVIEDGAGFGQPIAIGMIYFLVFAGIANLYFKKCELK